MLQLRTVLATGGLMLALLTGASAQVRDQRQVNTSAAGIISGRVEIDIDQRRTPVRWANLTLSSDDRKMSRATSDRDGHYRFDEIAAGDYQLRVEKPGFVTATIDVHATATGTANVVMHRGGAIEGRFIDDRGEAITRLTVTAERLAGLTDGNAPSLYANATDDLGRFRVHSLPPGQYRVYATPPPPASGERVFYPGTPDPLEARTITVAAGETRDGIDLTVAASPLSPIAAETMAAAAREAASAPEEPGFTARISGQLSMIDTGQPIVDASVQIASTAGAIRGIRYYAQTDGNGRFEFRRLASGEYVVSATARGYISVDKSLSLPDGAGTRVVIKDGERYDRANVALRRTSSIECRVFDEFGDPAPGVVVQVAQRGSALGLSRFRLDSSNAFRSTGTTDDRGWFRATGFFPGDYYLIAMPEPFERSSPGFGITYFPGVTSADSAQALHMTAGVDALDATFRVAAAGHTTISGAATDADGRPVASPLLILLPTDDDGEVRVIASARMPAEREGTFSFRDLPEGSYVLQGMAENMFGSERIVVGPSVGQVSRPVSLMLRKASIVRGRVTFVGGVGPATPEFLISFQATDLLSGPAGGGPLANRVSADGTFEMSGFPQRGLLRVYAPPGWALARILNQGRDITNAPFEFPASDMSGLEVVLTNRVGRVSGILVSGGQPLRGATVLVFGAESNDYSSFLQTVHAASTNGQGQFGVDGLLPGRYLALAVTSSNPIQDPTNVAALRSVATPVLVSEGGNTVVQLSIVK